MARIEFQGAEEYLERLARLGDNYEPVVRKMLRAGLDILVTAIRSAAPSQFASSIKGEAVKKNMYGLFARVKFEGKSRGGLTKAGAAGVYERGRKAGTSNKGRRYPAQPARPFVERTAKAAEQRVIRAMEDVYEQEVRRLGL